MRFSIIIVSLNAGDELAQTVENVLRQKCDMIEVIVKDGGSTDGSLEKIKDKRDARIHIYSQRDKGIYDAMNQAIDYVSGEYIIFMNCGDRFFNDSVLKDCAQTISDYNKKNPNVAKKTIFYGDCFVENRGYLLNYPDEFDDYVCFTKTLCHQSTIYPKELLQERKFSNYYRIAADFEYYVFAYRHGCTLKHLPITISIYKGDGASETAHNRNCSLKESKKVLKTHFSPSEYRRVWIKMQLRGVGIKRFLVKQKAFYGIYRKLAKKYYTKKQKN